MLRALRTFSVLVATLAAAPVVARAQDIVCDRGDTLVNRLTFTGNKAFTERALGAGIVTTPSSWVRRTFKYFGARHCLNTEELHKDSLRLLVYYHKKGYTSVRVGLTTKMTAPTKIEILFHITEGPPLIISEFQIKGLDSVPGRDAFLRGLGVAKGDPLDEYALDTASATLSRRLRNEGYPDADVLRSYTADTLSTRTAVVEFNVIPGPRAKIGRVLLDVEPDASQSRKIADKHILDVVDLNEGDLYRQRDLELAKRRLYLTDVYAAVDVRLDSVRRTVGRDTVVDVRIRAVEGKTRTTTGRVGWASLDCVRAEAQYGSAAFLGGLRRFDVTARASKIGIGDPSALDFKGLCRWARDDSARDSLNYYAAVSLRQSSVLGFHYVPTLTLFSERRSEFREFLRTTPFGAAATLAWALRPSIPMGASYTLEYDRTQADPTIFCAVFNVCDRADQEILTKTKRQTVLAYTIAHNGSDDLVDPRRGFVVSAEVRSSMRALGSDPDLQFNKLLTDATAYLPLTERTTIVGRVRLGTVLGSSLRLSENVKFIPLQERLYAGGANSVRGFTQNGLGALVYKMAVHDTVEVEGQTFFVLDTVAHPSRRPEAFVPTGGNSLVVGNLELRFRSALFHQRVEWVGFVDAGQVWTRGVAGTENLTFGSLKVTPGAGVRYFSDYGPIRLDVGYNPYAFPSGSAYFVSDLSEKGTTSPLFCVSPGNRLPVTFVTDSTGTRAQQAAGACPATYVPPARPGIFRRLALQISIGQAF